APVAQEGN
nr:RecName: Full=Chemolithotroph-specific protein [Thiomonas delicata]